MSSERDSQLLSIGQQCSESSCLLVDFLPFKCQHCSKSFCGEHFLVDAHHCPQYDETKHNRVAPSCPLCNTPVAIPPGEDPNIRMERHISTECSVMTGKSGRTRSHPVCARGKCGKVLYAPIACNGCRKQYCPQHRFPKDHSCSSLTSNPSSSKSSPASSSIFTQLASKAPAKTPTPRTSNATSRPTNPLASLSAPSLPSGIASLSNPLSKADRVSSIPTNKSKSASPSSSTPSPSSSPTVTPTQSRTECKRSTDSPPTKPLDPLSFVPPSIFASA